MNISLKGVARPGYPLGCNIEGAVKLVDEYVTAFKKLGYTESRVVNLWCRGSSGAILAGMFALKCNNPCVICHIKKENEDSHNGNTQPFNRDGINTVIDDFVASGETLSQIVTHIEKVNQYDGSGRFDNANLKLHVLMILDWEDANLHYTDKFTHKIGKRS